MAHHEIEHVHSAAGCVGQVLHIGCMPPVYIPEDDEYNPFHGDPELDFIYDDDFFLSVGGGGPPGGGPPGGHDAPGGGVDEAGPPRPRPDGHDVPGGGVIDEDPPDSDPHPPGGHDVPGGDVDDLPDDGGGIDPDPDTPAGDDVGGEPPGHVDIKIWSFRRTLDPEEYYTGDGTEEFPFMIPTVADAFGTTGDDVRARTVTWITALHTDVGQPAPAFQDI